MTGTATAAEEFKMTEIGPLPIEWGVTKFGELVAEITTGDWGETNPGNDLQKCYVLRGTDFSRVFKGSFANIPIRYLRPSSLQKRRLYKGDILIELSGGSKDQPTGRVAMVTGELIGRSTLPLVFSNFVKRLSVKSSLLPEFCWHYWEFLYQSGVTRTYEKRTTGIRNFKLDDFLASEYIPLPPLPEQKRITYFLSTVQTAIEKTEAVIRATRELKKSLMKHLFTYGPVSIDQVENIRLKETEIGMVLEEWEVKPLVDIATLQRGKDLPKQKQIWGKYPVVGSSGVMAYHNQAPCRGPGVVTGRSGSIGNLTYIEEDYWPHNTSLYVKDFHNNNPKFTYYLLHLIDFRKYATGVSVPTLNRNFVHVAMLPVPPSEVQRHIANILTMVDRRAETEENKRQALEALFKTLLTRLMTGKIRVNNLEAPV